MTMVSQADGYRSSEGVETASSPFGFDLQEIADVSKLGQKKPTDRRVCVCGHSIGSHVPGYRSKWLCSNGKLSCPCQNLHPVLEASDLRFFHYKTEGWGPRHALALGTQKCIERGGLVTPIVKHECFACRNLADRLIPTSLTMENVILDQPGPLNALLCPNCWSERTIRSY